MNFGWSYKQEHWNLFRNTFLNNSWGSCSFIYDSYSIVPKSRGVYLIITSPLKSNLKDTYQAPFDAMVTPLYIGESLNLQNRFKQHTSNKAETISSKLKWNKGIAKFFFTEFPKSTKEELRGFEQILISTFGPPMNKRNSQKEVVIKEPIQTKLIDLTKEIIDANLIDMSLMEELITRHEDKFTELKESYYHKDPQSDEQHIAVNHSILKTIASFLNTEGGYLIIGVSDDEEVVGLNSDPKYIDDDKYIRAIEDKINTCLCSHASRLVDFKPFTVNQKKILIVSCKKSNKPVWCGDVKYNQTKMNNNHASKHETLYIRHSRSTRAYEGRAAAEYITSTRRFST